MSAQRAQNLWSWRAHNIHEVQNNAGPVTRLLHHEAGGADIKSGEAMVMVVR